MPPRNFSALLFLAYPQLCHLPKSICFCLSIAVFRCLDFFVVLSLDVAFAVVAVFAAAFVAENANRKIQKKNIMLILMI